MVGSFLVIDGIAVAAIVQHKANQIAAAAVAAMGIFVFAAGKTLHPPVSTSSENEVLSIIEHRALNREKSLVIGELRS